MTFFIFAPFHVMNIKFVSRLCDFRFRSISHFHFGEESLQTGFCIVAPTIIDILLCNEKDVIEKDKQFVTIGEAIDVDIEIFEP